MIIPCAPTSPSVKILFLSASSKTFPLSVPIVATTGIVYPVSCATVFWLAITLALKDKALPSTSTEPAGSDETTISTEPSATLVKLYVPS